MSADHEISVVILYRHPLLGEGLARLLAAESDLVVAPVPARDLSSAEAALAGSPDVLIVEHGDRLLSADLLKVVPDTLIIELGAGTDPTFTYHREEIPGQPEAIVRAIRDLRSRGPAALAGLVGMLVAATSVSTLLSGG